MYAMFRVFHVKPINWLGKVRGKVSKLDCLDLRDRLFLIQQNTVESPINRHFVEVSKTFPINPQEFGPN